MARCRSCAPSSACSRRPTFSSAWSRRRRRLTRLRPPASATRRFRGATARDARNHGKPAHGHRIPAANPPALAVSCRFWEAPRRRWPCPPSLRVRFDNQGAFIVTLENGQVWRQTDTEPTAKPHFRVGEKITILPGALWSYNLKTESDAHAYKVGRAS